MTQAKKVLASYEDYLRSLGPVISSDMKDVLLVNPVYFDFCTESQGVLPWEDSGKYVPLLFNVWEDIKESLLPVFQTRKSRCGQNDMLKGIVCLLASFHWTAGERVKSLDWAELTEKSFPAKPINWAERVEFILLKPTQYHCFIQLDELFTEMKKHFYKYHAMNR
ncbi:YpoC family protein [Bacillus cabrialesii subsp. cabrialesii]|uniref:YpoC family protein n=1 Tax=Bacillus cabrialesii TaxID=2487276 RepID=UPI0033063F06